MQKCHNDYSSWKCTVNYALQSAWIVIKLTRCFSVIKTTQTYYSYISWVIPLSMANLNSSEAFPHPSWQPQPQEGCLLYPALTPRKEHVVFGAT